MASGLALLADRTIASLELPKGREDILLAMREDQSAFKTAARSRLSRTMCSGWMPRTQSSGFESVNWASDDTMPGQGLDTPITTALDALVRVSCKVHDPNGSLLVIA